MILEEDKVVDTDQEPIPIERVDKWHEIVGHGEQWEIQKIRFGDKIYHRIPTYGDITWKDEDRNSLDRTEMGEELELALEAKYREKFF